MNQEPLDEMIRQAVDRAHDEAGGQLDEDAVVERVLADPDVRLLLRGVEDHDRAEGLTDVYLRDIRRKVAEYLARRNQTE
jgi:hypothetical protein